MMSRKALVTEKTRAEMIRTCREITRVLDSLESRAGLLGMTPQHASLQTRLAVFHCRLRAGDSSLRLILEMTTFIHEYNTYVEVLAS